VSDETYVHPKYLWMTLARWQEYGYTDLVAHLGGEVQRVLPTLPLSGAKEWIQEAPELAQVPLWQLWASRADLSGFSLRYMDKQTRDLSPAVLVIVWCAWFRQVDVSMYGRNELHKAAQHWPLAVNEKITEVVERLHPHLASPRRVKQLPERAK